MESMTEECQVEFSKAASSVPEYAKMQGASRDPSLCCCFVFVFVVVFESSCGEGAGSSTTAAKCPYGSTGQPLFAVLNCCVCNPLRCDLNRPCVLKPPIHPHPNTPERMVRAQAEATMRKNGRQADPNTPYYLGATLLLLFVAVVGYVVYVNQKLKEAGLLDRKVCGKMSVCVCRGTLAWLALTALTTTSHTFYSPRRSARRSSRRSAPRTAARPSKNPGRHCHPHDEPGRL